MKKLTFVFAFVLSTFTMAGAFADNCASQNTSDKVKTQDAPAEGTQSVKSESGERPRVAPDKAPGSPGVSGGAGVKIKN